MRGDATYQPYKLASNFKQDKADDNLFVLEVYGPAGVGVVHVTQPGTIQQVMAAAESFLNNTPALKGYYL